LASKGPQRVYKRTEKRVRGKEKATEPDENCFTRVPGDWEKDGRYGPQRTRAPRFGQRNWKNKRRLEGGKGRRWDRDTKTKGNRDIQQTVARKRV